MIEGNVIGREVSAKGNDFVNAYNPGNGEALPGDFKVATPAEIENAVKKAKQAFAVYRNTSGLERAEFLATIAEEILALGDELVQRVVIETGLPEGRVVGERGRTVGQLRLFADLLSEGSWVEASIDTAIPDREPIPKPDIRKMLRPVGPVVVFTASNFPLAFSTAGGDTASALAAGNPVIVKAHESHLGTNQLIAEAIKKASQKCDMPDGVFSSLIGAGFSLGQSLVMHRSVKSVAFTGSFKGGKVLYDLAANRDEPIPVFAEMGSINPVILLPAKLADEGTQLAAALAGSITLGVGQFCTNPGLIIGVKGHDLDVFGNELARAINAAEPGVMLNSGILENYKKRKATVLETEGVVTLANTDPADLAGAAVAKVDASLLIANPDLAHEVFGPYSLLVQCDDILQINDAIRSLKGQLTTTFLANDAEISRYEQLVDEASQVAGRVILNGVPTGVEVCDSMQHGGPFPATTDSRFTSVGTDAIKRFVRPVAYQSMTEVLLPDELKSENPLNILRKVNGEYTRNVV